MGTIIDYLIPPITSIQILLAMTLGGITRGILVAILVFIAISFFQPLAVFSISHALFYLITSSAILAILGIISGIISETYDHMASITTFFITPLTFLSGTFYSIHNLPETIKIIVKFNPFFYMIDGFRYSMTGYHDGSIIVGSLYLFLITIILTLTCLKMLNSGYKLKN